MIERDGAVQDMLDERHPYGAIGGGGPAAVWLTSRKGTRRDGKVREMLAVFASGPDGTPFVAMAEQPEGEPPPRLPSHDGDAKAPADWVRQVGAWRDAERHARSILAGTRPRYLDDEVVTLARSVERHAPEVRGAGAKLAQAAHAVLDRMALLEAHAGAVLPPGLAAFAIGKEPALCNPGDWFTRFRGPLLDACLARPHAWKALARYQAERRGRFDELAAAGRHDTLAHEALVHDGLKPSLVRRLPEASDALAALADMPQDAALGLFQPVLAASGLNRVVPSGMSELADYPANWVPRDPEGWRAALGLVHHLPSLRAIKQAHADPSILPALVDAGGDWVGYRATLLRAARVEDVAGITAALAGVQDMCDAFRDQIVDTALALSLGLGPKAGMEDTSRVVRHRLRTRFSVNLLLSGRSLAGMLEDQAAWHLVQGGIGDALRFGPHGLSADNRGWRAGFPDADIGDVRIVVLTDRDQLRAEGGAGPDADGVEGLDHCVGSYAGRCIVEGVRVASVRRTLPGGGFERLATLELRMMGSHPHEVQLRGRGNAEPPPPAARAAREYVMAMRTGALAIDSSFRLNPGKARPTVADILRLPLVGGRRMGRRVRDVATAGPAPPA